MMFLQKYILVMSLLLVATFAGDGAEPADTAPEPEEKLKKCTDNNVWCESRLKKKRGLEQVCADSEDEVPPQDFDTNDYGKECVKLLQGIPDKWYSENPEDYMPKVEVQVPVDPTPEDTEPEERQEPPKEEEAQEPPVDDAASCGWFDVACHYNKVKTNISEKGLLEGTKQVAKDVAGTVDDTIEQGVGQAFELYDDKVKGRTAKDELHTDWSTDNQRKAGKVTGYVIAVGVVGTGIYFFGKTIKAICRKLLSLCGCCASKDKPAEDDKTPTEVSGTGSDGKPKVWFFFDYTEGHSFLGVEGLQDKYGILVIAVVCLTILLIVAGICACCGDDDEDMITPQYMMGSPSGYEEQYY